MDTLTFISSLFEAMAWPAVVLAAIILLRGPLSNLIPEIRRLKYKGLEVDFGQGLKKIQETIGDKGLMDKPFQLPNEVEVDPLPQTQSELVDRLADLSPPAAILESWRNVERTIDFYFAERGIERPRSGQSITQHLDYDPNFPPSLVFAYKELRFLRNMAVHEGDQITTEHAREFSSLSDSLLRALVDAAHQ